MIRWITGLLLAAGGIVASWILDKDSPDFPLVQMMIATLVLAAVVGAIVYWRSLLEYWQLRRRPRE